MKAVICGPIRNCAKYIPQVINNMLALGTLFEEFVIIFSYDISFDKTLQILKHYQHNIPNMIVYENPSPMLLYRTHRIAKARNECLHIARTKYPSYDYMIMMDCDNVNSKRMNLSVVSASLKDTTWDALSFMTSPVYYDIWALSIVPYMFSYNHFDKSYEQYYVIQRHVTQLLRQRKGYLPCLSAFNGFGLYRLNKFKNCLYDGRVNLSLLPRHFMQMHSNAAKSRIIFRIYKDRLGFVNVNGMFEDCEHRAFHAQGIFKNGANIFISPEVVFF